MNILRTLRALTITLLISTQALAGTHTIIINNPSGNTVRFFSVMNAEVIGFKSTKATQFKVTVELPETGVCNPRVRVTMGNGERIEGRVAICRNEGFTISDK